MSDDLRIPDGAPAEPHEYEVLMPDHTWARFRRSEVVRPHPDRQDD